MIHRFKFMDSNFLETAKKVEREQQANDLFVKIKKK